MPNALRGNSLVGLACLAFCTLFWRCDGDDIDVRAVRAASSHKSTVASTTQPPPPSAATKDLLTLDAPQLFERIRKSGKRGTLVNVWASWCGSCRDEIPMLLSLRSAFEREGLDFAFVSADEPAAFTSVVELMRSLKGPLPALAVAGSMNSFKQAMRPDWHGALPATFLFDATAKLRYFWEGPVYDHEITPIVQGFLAGETIDGATRPALRGGPG
jgi:thiol-disulfide isomerase/thioredoxin